MSNIVVLSGSVRKGGNTELLVQAFVDGAKKNNNVEVISVADYKVNPCIGCNTCFDRESGAFGGGDVNGILYLMPQAWVWTIFAFILLFNIWILIKKVNPTYTESFKQR